MRTASAEETKATGAAFAAGLSPRKEGATVICLKGDLGSGKTTFVQGMAAAFAIKGPIQSPTFVIEKRYPLQGETEFSNFIHIDAYRIEDERELIPLLFSETASDRGNLIVVEWPERIENVLPKYAMTISFTFVDEKTRDIQTPKK